MCTLIRVCIKALQINDKITGSWTVETSAIESLIALRLCAINVLSAINEMGE